MCRNSVKISQYLEFPRQRKSLRTIIFFRCIFDESVNRKRGEGILTDNLLRKRYYE